MKLAELMKTPRAKAARKQLSDKGYLAWLLRAIDADVVVFEHREFLTDKRWAIQVVGTDYWLECTKTKQEALALCEQMGWRVEK
jgi:hypothetical protein